MSITRLPGDPEGHYPGGDPWTNTLFDALDFPNHAIRHAYVTRCDNNDLCYILRVRLEGLPHDADDRYLMGVEKRWPYAQAPQMLAGRTVLETVNLYNEWYETAEI